MDPILSAIVLGVASNEATLILEKVVEKIWGRSNYAMTKAASREFAAYLHDKGIVDESLAPVVAYIETIHQKQAATESLIRDANESLVRIIRYQLSPEARENLELQALLLPGVFALSKDPLPGELLRAGAEAVPFVGREQELEELFGVWNNDEPVSICLITGPGGAGKTRLMVEWVRRLLTQGHVEGFLPHYEGEDKIQALFGGTGKRAVVVDYAETRVSLVKTILERAAQRSRSDTKLHLVLLARNAGEWWERIGEDSFDVKRIAAHQGRQKPLPDLMQSGEERRSHYQSACERFAQIQNKPSPTVQAPDFTLDHFAHPLFIPSDPTRPKQISSQFSPAWRNANRRKNVG